MAGLPWQPRHCLLLMIIVLFTTFFAGIIFHSHLERLDMEN